MCTIDIFVAEGWFQNFVAVFYFFCNIFVVYVATTFNTMNSKTVATAVLFIVFTRDQKAIDNLFLNCNSTL